jgi:monoamine oxidase
MADVIVIGAGMAGVTAARELVRAGISVSVVEGRDRIGGRIYSVRDFCGAPVEAGAEFIHGVDAETWPDVRAAGLAVRPCPYTRDTMFNIGHGAHWLPRILLHPGVWPTLAILRSIARLKPPDMSAREFIEKRGFTGRAKVIAEMVLTAHLPGSIDEVGLLGLVEDKVLKLESGVNHRVSQGYDALPQFMARGLDVRFGFDVDTIDWSGDGMRVTSKSGDEMVARAAISTLPVGVIKSGQVNFIPELPASKREALRSIVMGPVVRVLLKFKEPFWPKKLATLACGVGPVTLYWAVCYGMQESSPPVLTAYATGPRAARLSAVSEQEAADIAVDDLCRLFPKADPKRQLEAYRRIDWPNDPFARGGYTFLVPGGTGARAKLAAPNTGALFWAGSATATTTISASVQGAYVSGQLAAHQVQRLLQSANDPEEPRTSTLAG